MKTIALLGAGRWGQRLLDHLHQRQVLHTVWTRNPARYTCLQKAYPGVEWTNDLARLWNHPAIQAVVIATPAPTHPALIEAALQAGKSVLCEKPLAFSADQLRRLIDLAESKGLLLMGGHVLHYHPAVEAIQTLLQEGKLGKLLSYTAERGSLGRFPLAEDALWGLAIHDIALLLHLFEGEPALAGVHTEAHLQENTAEAVWIHLGYDWGLKAHLHASWIAPERRRRITLVGHEGMLVFSEEGATPSLRLYPHRFQWSRGATPVMVPAEGLEVPFSAEEPLAREIDDFLRCLETRTAPRTAAQALLPATRLAEKIHRQLFPAAEAPQPYFVHPTALLDEEVEIGEGTRIWHFSHILRGSRIGKNCVLGQNVVVGPFVRVGNNCKIQNNVSLYYGVELEDGVLCGPSCVFTNDKYPRAFIERRNEFLQTRVRQGATLGANATIMCGVTIGRFAMIGAGAVVTQDVPDHALVLGNPARQMGWVCECGETLEELQPDSLYRCERCDFYYRRTLKGLEKVSSSSAK